MTNNQRCQIMRLLVPPAALSHIILRIEDGTISHAGAKIVFDEVYQRNRTVLSKLLGVEECRGWVCPKCGVDRTKDVCPQGHMAAVEGKCPMIGVAQ